MANRRQEIRVTMELADSAIQLDSDAIADAFAHDLQSDTVMRWADGVRDAIAATRQCPNPLRTAQDDGDSRKRADIRAKIATLQRQLSELEKQ